ncbi:hypothetical protein DH2020_031255 [Rehmannia glutinosa]|uniref:histone acetyltransferase n=1 Tax=Rehmannia glutinosa TaxID=99300 RepID=A0ABR0VKU9_REHGL
MNLQTHHSGQVSGQVPNQAGGMLPGLSQQNGNPVLSQMQNPGVRRNAPSMDPEIVKTRRYMQEKIWEFLMQKRPQSHDVPNKKLVDLVKRLEEGLFKSATTKEEYINLATLETRLHFLIKRLPMINHNQQLSHANSSPSIGTMIPTPGFQQTGNANLVGTSSVDNSNTIASSTVNTGSFVPTQNGGSFGSSDGALASGYQQSSPAFLINNGGNRSVTSMGTQRTTSQMIPTPGINNSNNSDVNINNANNNTTLINVESLNSGGASPAVESTSASQPVLQKQNVGGDRYGTADASGSGNMSVPVTSVGSMMNNQSLNTLSMQSMPKETSPLMTNNQSNVYSTQQSQISSNLDEGLQSQVPNPFHFSGMQNQFQHNSVEEQLLSHPSGPQDVFSSQAQTSEQMQQFGANPQNDFGGLSGSIKPDVAQPNNLSSDRLPFDQSVQDEFHHRLTGQDVAQPNNLSSEESVIGQSDTFQSAEHLNTTDASMELLIPLILLQLRKVNSKDWPSGSETTEDLQPPIKRTKIDIEPSVALASDVNDCLIQDAQHIEQHHDSHIPKKSEITEVKMEVLGSVGQLSPKNIEMKQETMHDAYIHSPEVDPVAPNNPAGFGVQEAIKTEKEIGQQAKLEITSVHSENTSKSGKPKIKGVSMIELFTPEQVRQHIMGLRKWVGQSRAKAERNQAMEHLMSENSCQLCAVEKLTFEPPPIYCTPCGARIKRNAMYYTVGAGETRHCFCIPCYNEARGDTIVVDGTTIPKARVEKKKNDEETEEWWVQCDKCEAWQHQICALFNGRRNDGGQAEYTCPNCYVAEVERGERLPLPQSAVLGAKDLPRTNLSDHLEQRLFAKLKQERQDRARVQGKSYDEVPGAEALVVRVVSSVDKKLDVKLRFLDIFREENYPMEFPYKSKVVLLFQRIEGVEVCLFGMYVQEFGSNASSQIIAESTSLTWTLSSTSGQISEQSQERLLGHLCTMKFWQVSDYIIGYLEYCKRRGLSCYIWACPPLKGEDYILYCHPEIQKTPKSDKLLEWYLCMLRKASKENIVVDLTNLYEHFFVSTGECKAKVTAARLPYFDGDYWPGAAEDIIYQLQQEDDGRKQHKKGTLKKSITKRALKASGQTDLSGNASKDLMLMHKLGETISPMKEDFIMVHLQHACSHCCILMVFGTRWVCKQCKNFQLCDKWKSLGSLMIPKITKFSREFFDTRQAFLSLCQGNHYQYDTLRRAKHSSMMVLYHLHNPTAPAFVTTCKDGGIDHPHALTNCQSNDHDAQNKEARQLRVTQLRKCLISWCMLLNVGLHIANIQIVARDLKEHMRRLQQQSDSDEAAVME